MSAEYALKQKTHEEKKKLTETMPEDLYGWIRREMKCRG